MAIRVNKVYQKVLALANKEQRGYITPQEFNLFADMAQTDIFEQYFYDLEQRQRGTGSEYDYSDIANNIQEKINMFQVFDSQYSTNNNGICEFLIGQSDFYRIGTVQVFYNYKNVKKLVEEIQINELKLYSQGVGKYTENYPIYHSTGTGIKIYPTPQSDNGDKVFISYIRKPVPPNWTYITVANQGAAVYHPNADHRDFELHDSEENKLIVKILQFAGVKLKDQQLIQAASAQEVGKTQQEKQ
tara:strand:- start:281 stop:1012 length:732 start_codon:yes stop_codon:yes gene_type:complete